MNIVILDGYAANNGDLSWAALEELGSLTVYPRTAPSEVIERASTAEAVFVNKVVLDADTLKALPNLKFIGVLATGFNNVDVFAARRQGITVCNVPAYSTDSVVQTVFAHLLNITNHVQEHAESVQRGEWQKSPDFSYRLTRLIELSGLTMGIYGLGNIGKSVARVAHAFGMNVIALTSKVPWQLPQYINPVEKKELFVQSDVLVLCAPLTSQNKYFVNSETISLMKPSAIIINTARGGMVDSQAVATALKDGRLYACGADVLECEPPRNGDPLIGAPNSYLTPHCAWQGDVARRELIRISAENLKAFINGKPINVVN